MSILIAQFKNETDADLVARIIKKIQRKKDKVDVMSDEDWEDYVLGKMADDAEVEGGIVPREKVAQSFRKHGIDF